MINYPSREFYHHLGLLVDTKRTRLIEILENENELLRQTVLARKLTDMFIHRDGRLMSRTWNSIDDYFKKLETTYPEAERLVPEPIIIDTTSKWIERVVKRIPDSVILYADSYSIPNYDKSI